MPAFLIPTLAALAYLTAGALLLRSTRADGPSLNRAALALAVPALVLHGWTHAEDWHVLNGPDLHFFAALSLVSLGMAALTTFASLSQRVQALGVVVYPLAAAMLLLFNGYGHGNAEDLDWRLMLHAWLALLAYATLALSALLAVMLWFQERALRQRQIHGWLRALPPLTQLETLLFRSLTAGFALATLPISAATITTDIAGIDAGEISIARQRRPNAAHAIAIGKRRASALAPCTARFRGRNYAELPRDGLGIERPIAELLELTVDPCGRKCAGREKDIGRARRPCRRCPLIECRATARGARRARRRIGVLAALDHHLVTIGSRGPRSGTRCRCCGRRRCHRGAARRRGDHDLPRVRLGMDLERVSGAARIDLELRRSPAVDRRERWRRRHLAYKHHELIVRRHLRRVTVTLRKPQRDRLPRREDRTRSTKTLDRAQIDVDL